MNNQVNEISEPSVYEDINLSTPAEFCLACGGPLNASWLYRQFRVCPNCRFHFAITPQRRTALIADEGTFYETNTWVRLEDFLDPSSKEKYADEIQDEVFRTGLKNAVVTGRCSIGGIPAELIILDFGFLGGHIGPAASAKIGMAIRRAKRRNLPGVAIIAGGSSRPRFGFSPFTHAAGALLATDEFVQRGRFITVMANPVSGPSVFAFAAKADFILAEPGINASISEVQAQKTRESSESLLKSGQVDCIVDRERLKATLANLLDLTTPRRKAARRPRWKKPSSVPVKRWHVVPDYPQLHRPTTRDYIDRIFYNFSEIRGDRIQGDSSAVVTGFGNFAGHSVAVLGLQRKIVGAGVAKTTITSAGLRKATRLIEMASKLELPLIMFMDATEFGRRAKIKGLATALSRAMSAILNAESLMVSVIIGECYGEVPLVMSLAENVLLLENASFTLSPPEDVSLTVTVPDETEQNSPQEEWYRVQNAIQGITLVNEPQGGAQNSYNRAAVMLAETLAETLQADLREGADPPRVRRQRYLEMREERSTIIRRTLQNEVRALQTGIITGMQAFRDKLEPE